MQMNKTDRKKRIWPWVVVSAVVLVVVVAFFLNLMGRSSSAPFQSYTVSRGDVELTITGGGTLQAKEVENIDLPDSISISQVLAKAGDNIKKGDILATFDYNSLVNRAAYLSNELATVDRAIRRRETSKYIYSPVAGRIKHLSVSKGDDVVGVIGEQGALAIVSTDGLMKIEITTEQELALHSEVTVKFPGTSKTGEVARRTAFGYVITFTDKGSPYNEPAQVFAGKSLIGEGITKINAPITVYGNSGEIKKVHYSENAYISAGSILFTLNDAVVTNRYQLAQLERETIAKQLQAVLLYMSNSKMIANYDGLISEVMISDHVITGGGNASSASAKSGSGFSVAFTIHTGGAVKMYINVDELDINSVVLGQEVTVTLDAFQGESYTAKVAHISKIGTPAGNITTYPVELSLDYNEHFFEGMNGNGVIMVERVENVLLVPIVAIYEDSTGVYVYTVSGEKRTRVEITTGISDGINVEVISGLSEGDVIQYMDVGSPSTEAPGGIPMPGGGNRNPFTRGGQ